MVDKHLMDQMESILSRLSIPVMLADKDPEAQMTGNELPLEQITDGLIQPVRGMLYLGVNQPAVVLYCEENLPGARDVLMLAESLVTTLASGSGREENAYDVYRRALRGELVGAELEALAMPTAIRAARSQAQEYETIRKNVDALLSVPKEQEQQRRHELE